MADQLKELRERIEQMELEARAKWRPLAQVTPNAARLFAQLEDDLNHAKQVARGAAHKAEGYLQDDTLYPEGRARLAREATQEGQERAKDYLRRAQGCVSVIAAETQHALVPPLDPAREMPARDELRMLVEMSPDPVAAMQEATARSRELASVACSSYGESLLRAKGVHDAPEHHSAVRMQAAASAMASGDPAYELAGKAYRELSTLENLPALARSSVEQALGADGPSGGA